MGSEHCVLLGSTGPGAEQPPYCADPCVLGWVCCWFTKVRASLGHEALGRGAAQDRAAMSLGSVKDFIQVGGKLEVIDE